MGSLAAIYGRDELNRPADAEKVARRLVDEDPRSAKSLGVLAQVLRESDRQGEATELLRKARFDLPASQERDLVVYMFSHVNLSPKLPRGDIQTLVDDMLAIADGWLVNKPNDPTGPIAKHLALELRANRLEHDPTRKRELLGESELWEKASDKRGVRMDRYDGEVEAASEATRRNRGNRDPPDLAEPDRNEAVEPRLYHGFES